MVHLLGAMITASFMKIPILHFNICLSTSLFGLVIFKGHQKIPKTLRIFLCGT